MQAVGEVAAFYQNIRTGRMTPILKLRNKILYQGADIMAALLGGDLNHRISHMYMEFENTAGAPALPTINRDNGRSYFAAIDGTGNRDWVRVPIIMNPSLSIVPNDSVDYSGNTVMFVATTASVDPAQGKADASNYFADAGPDGPSKIFSLGLVAATDQNNEGNDKVFSRVNLSTAMPLQPSSHIVFFWSIKFN